MKKRDPLSKYEISKSYEHLRKEEARLRKRLAELIAGVNVTRAHLRHTRETMAELRIAILAKDRSK